ALTAWDGTAGTTAADVIIASNSVAVVDDSIAGLALGNYYLKSTSTSGVSVTGTVKGRNVSITADSKTEADDDFNPLKTTVQFLQDYGVAKLLEQVGSS